MNEAETPKPSNRTDGRGTRLTLPNRFERVQVEQDFEQLDPSDEELLSRKLPTIFIDDTSRSVVSENHSPDVSFRYSLNPYRGCEHGCPYCYARPTHEYLGFNAGIDFETKVVVKRDAPQLFRDWLNRPNWSADAVILSGVTDCYQPAERQLELTRACLEVANAANQPVSIITKNALILRDLDLLASMASRRLVHVSLSITTLDAALARALEPRASRPEARLRAIKELSAAGVPVRVMVAPVIPGLTDSEIPAILQAAAESGAQHAAYTYLRLPLAVGPVFLDWLQRNRPAHASKIEGLIRTARGGRLNDSRFGQRFRGEGERAEQIQATFKLFARRHQLDQTLVDYDFSMFRPPTSRNGQKSLF